MNKLHVLRLLPGNDLKKEIQAFLKKYNIEAGYVVCCVGSLTQYCLRFANQNSGNRGNGYFEIVSIMGTVSVNGSHIHLSVSDEKGLTTGGHLLEGNIIYTTAEIIIQEVSDYLFTREEDGTTGYAELQITKKPQ